MNKLASIAAAVSLLSLAIAQAQKPDKPGKGGGEEPAPYKVVDLFGLTGVYSGGTFIQSYALAVNEPDETGKVYAVGNSFTPNTADGSGGNYSHPVIWEIGADGSFTFSDLGLPDRARDATATDINNWGAITINTLQPSEEGTPILPAWVSIPGMPLQQLPSGDFAEARAINAFGRIVGTDEPSGAAWQLDESDSPGNPTNLGRFYPADVDDFGVMSGHDWGVPAIAWFDENNVLQIQNLGTGGPYFISGEATAISSNGTWVAGWIDVGGAEEAFVWSDATGMIPLGTLGGDSSMARSVNNAGEVVGWSDTGDRKRPVAAFVWQGNQMLDLNALVDGGGKIHLQSAKAINNAGHIVGFMEITSKRSPEEHAFVLIPSIAP